MLFQFRFYKYSQALLKYSTSKLVCLLTRVRQSWGKLHGKTDSHNMIFSLSKTLRIQGNNQGSVEIPTGFIMFTHLWHVSNPFSRHSTAFGPGLASQHPDLPRIQPSSAYNTTEQRRLTATTGSEETISERERTHVLVKMEGLQQK